MPLGGVAQPHGEERPPLAGPHLLNVEGQAVGGDPRARGRVLSDHRELDFPGEGPSVPGARWAVMSQARGVGGVGGTPIVRG